MITDSGFHFLTDEEEAAELADVGINVEPRDASQEQRDAIASYQMRAIYELDTEISERTRGMDNEIALIRARFARLLDPLRIRREQKEAYVRLLAQISMECGGFGKAKSRKVGYGQYGSRVKKGGLVVQDANEVLDWAITNCPEVVRGTLVLPIKVAQKMSDELEVPCKAEVKKSLLNEYFAASGEEIPGTVVEQDVTEFFAKAEPLV